MLFISHLIYIMRMTFVRLSYCSRDFLCSGCSVCRKNLSTSLGIVIPCIWETGSSAWRPFKDTKSSNRRMKFRNGSPNHTFLIANCLCARLGRQYRSRNLFLLAEVFAVLCSKAPGHLGSPGQSSVSSQRVQDLGTALHRSGANKSPCPLVIFRINHQISRGSSNALCSIFHDEWCILFARQRSFRW
jgi:hypothetical protein